MKNEHVQSFESVKTRLDEIVDAVSANDISLDDALDLYEEAIKLGMHVSSLLEEDVSAEQIHAHIALSESPASEEGVLDADGVRTDNGQPNPDGRFPAEGLSVGQGRALVEKAPEDADGESVPINEEGYGGAEPGNEEESDLQSGGSEPAGGVQLDVRSGKEPVPIGEEGSEPAGGGQLDLRSGGSEPFYEGRSDLEDPVRSGESHG